MAVIYKLSGISLEYDAIFDKNYSIAIGELYTGTILIPYIKVTSIHDQKPSNKTLLGRLTLAICLFVHSKAYCYYFLIN